MQEHGINPAGAGQREDGQLQDLTRKQLLELEREKKTKLQLWLDLLIWLSPFLGGLVSILEYTQIPDNSLNRNPGTYLGFLFILIAGLWDLLRSVACGSDPGKPGHYR